MKEPLPLCPVCAARMRPAFTKVVLFKYSVQYFECGHCGLVTTEHPYWLAEAYSVAIADLDTGLVQRNIRLAGMASRIIQGNFDAEGAFVDFAGGYGLFVRLMRDSGFNFYWRDKYCTNIFARHFSASESEKSYELVTAFEVFEHLTDPRKEITEIASLADNVFFTTQVRPDSIDEVEDWWYLVPETGQHITFYSVKALELLAEMVGRQLYTDGTGAHIFSSRNDLLVFAGADTRQRSFGSRLVSRIRRRVRGLLPQQLAAQRKKRKSLIWADHEAIKSALHGVSKQ